MQNIQPQTALRQVHCLASCAALPLLALPLTVACNLDRAIRLKGVLLFNILSKKRPLSPVDGRSYRPGGSSPATAHGEIEAGRL